MNVYSELWALLRPVEQPSRSALLGTVTAVAPLAVTVGDTTLTRQLYLPAGTTLTQWDIGRQAVLIPCGESAFIVIFVEGGDEL